MEKEIIKLIGDLNEKLYVNDRDVVNNFSYTTEGIFFHVKYGDTIIASDYDTHFNYSIEEVKSEMKKNMWKLADDIKSDLQLIDG
jgi:hypothetical protein